MLAGRSQACICQQMAALVIGSTQQSYVRMMYADAAAVTVPCTYSNVIASVLMTCCFAAVRLHA